MSSRKKSLIQLETLFSDDRATPDACDIIGSLNDLYAYKLIC